MKRKLLFIALVTFIAVILSGCSGLNKPRIFHFPSYPEQEQQSSPRYDLTHGKGITASFSSASITPSTKIENIVSRPDDLPNDLKKSVVFDVKSPVKNQPFVVKITYRSNTDQYFVGVALDGSYTETIAATHQPGVQYAIVGTYPNGITSGIKVFGDGKWDMEIQPLASLPVFDKQMSGEGDKAFIVNGRTHRVSVNSGGAGFLIYSYGYENRIAYNKSGGGSQLDYAALPGSGAVILVHGAEQWTIKEVKKVANAKN